MAPAEISSGKDAAIEHRVVQTVCATAALAAMATVLWRGPRIGLAVALGAGLNLLSFFWLRRGVAALFAPAAPRRGLFAFTFRFALLGAALYAIVISHLVPVHPVLWGLLAVPAGVFLAVTAEAVRSLI